MIELFKTFCILVTLSMFTYLIGTFINLVTLQEYNILIIYVTVVSYIAYLLGYHDNKEE